MSQGTPHALVALARQSILYYLTQGEILKPPAELPPDMLEPAGVFVSLKSQGRLRGCIGTCLPMQPTVTLEVLHNAVGAAIADPRFPPLTLDEMDVVEISVDVLTQPEPVMHTTQLDPKRYGVIVQAGAHVGVLLPDIPEITTVEQQLAIARLKAGIPPDEPAMIYRFEVSRYH